MRLDAPVDLRVAEGLEEQRLPLGSLLSHRLDVISLLVVHHEAQAVAGAAWLDVSRSDHLFFSNTITDSSDACTAL